MPAESDPVMPDKPSFVMTFVTGLWLLAVGFGLLVLLQYSYRPGAVGAALKRWPGETKLQFVDRKTNLIMFLHPKCPCSRASVREFEEIVARCHDLLHAQIVFVQPHDVSDAWVKTDLWNAARAIPGAAVSIDSWGRSAEQFGARTSGHTLLFDSERALVFSGGITSSRGHEGDSAGRDAIVEFMQTGASARHEQSQFSVLESPVFGCPLLGAADNST
jgi:hypothetical protein